MKFGYVYKVVLKTVDFIIKIAYRCTLSYQRDQLNLIRLEKPRIYKPTADIQTILQWERVFVSHDLDRVEESLKIILINLIVMKKHRELDFDFSRIQSLSASKSFGCGYENQINGSWFEDIASWGKGMFPNERLSALDESDWLDNIWHIEHEGFHKGNIIHIYYYEWLDRYLGSNSGGSHHAALIAHQIRNQGRAYSREAEITTYGIDISLIDDLEPYYCFITGRKSISSNIGEYNYDLDYILKSFATNTVYTFEMNATENNCSLFIVPKIELKIPQELFESWLSSRSKLNEVIILKDILREHRKYCTTPYLHELRSIYLGDPSRHNDVLKKSADMKNG